MLAYGLEATASTHNVPEWLSRDLSICLSLKVEGAPALGTPVSPHHNVCLQESPNAFHIWA